MNLELKKIDNIKVDGIDTRDYPDFCDAYISEADYKGVPMTEKEIEYLNDNHGDFVYDAVMDHFC